MADKLENEEIVIPAGQGMPLSFDDRVAKRRLRVVHSGLDETVPALRLRRPTAAPRWWRHDVVHSVWSGARTALVEEARYGHGFLFVPVVIALGAVIWLLSDVDPPVWPLAIVLVILVASVLWPAKGQVTKCLLIASALVITGMLLAQIESWRRSTIVLDTAVTTDLVGTIERGEKAGAGRMRYVISLASTANPQIKRVPGQVLLIVRAQHDPFPNGATVTGRARLSPPAGPALPGLHDFAFSSYFDGIGAVGYFYAAPRRIEGDGVATSWFGAIQRWLFDLRAGIGNRIRSLAPGDAGAFAAAIVTDERRAISDGTVEALRVSGLAHIVAISGLNMALAAGIFFLGLRSVLALFPGLGQRWPIKKIAAAGALMMVTAYYLISGFGVSAQRAYIMMAVMLFAVLVDRPSISLRNVALSAIIILVWTPSEVLGPSFQMSFAATVALVAGYAAWAKRADAKPAEPLPISHSSVIWFVRGWKFIAGIVMTSLIGSLATTMFSVEHFHRIATYGLAANLAAMPIISFLVMPAGLVAMLLMPFGLDGPFIAVMASSLEWVVAIARHVAGWGGDYTVGQQPSTFLAYGVCGFLLLTLLRTRLRYLGLPLLLLALIQFSLGVRQPQSSLLVAEDGTLAGFRSGEAIVVNRGRVPDFIYGQWRRARHLPEPTPPIMREDWRDEAVIGERGLHLTGPLINQARRRMWEADDDRFICQPKAWCSFMSPVGVLVVVVEDARFTGIACDIADLVISPRARFDECRSGVPLLSGKSLRKTGALEVDFAGFSDSSRWNVQTAMAVSSRPWSIQRQYDWRRNVYDASLPAWLANAMRGSNDAPVSTSTHQPGSVKTKIDGSEDVDLEADLNEYQ